MIECYVALSCYAERLFQNTKVWDQ